MIVKILPWSRHDLALIVSLPWRLPKHKPRKLIVHYLQFTEVTFHWLCRVTSMSELYMVRVIGALWARMSRPAKRLQRNYYVYMVRVRRVELLSQPWEGHIMAVIRHPLDLCMQDSLLACFEKPRRRRIHFGFSASSEGKRAAKR